MSTYSPVDELTLSMKWAVDEMAVDEMSTYSPVDELTLSMKWAVNEMAVD